MIVAVLRKPAAKIKHVFLAASVKRIRVAIIQGWQFVAFPYQIFILRTIRCSCCFLSCDLLIGCVCISRCQVVPVVVEYNNCFHSRTVLQHSFRMLPYTGILKSNPSFCRNLFHFLHFPLLLLKNNLFSTAARRRARSQLLDVPIWRVFVNTIHCCSALHV